MIVSSFTATLPRDMDATQRSVSPSKRNRLPLSLRASSETYSNASVTRTRLSNWPKPCDEGDSSISTSGTRPPCSLQKVPPPEPHRPTTVPSLSSSPLSPTKAAARLMMTTVADRMTQQPALMVKALRRYDPQHTGSISTPSLQSACSKLFGINDEAQRKIVDALDPEGTGMIKIQEFLSTFERLDPLGGISDPVKLGLQNNVMTAAPWEEKRGTMTAYNWDRIPTLQNHASSPTNGRKKALPQDDSTEVATIESPTRKVAIPRSLTDPSALAASDKKIKYLTPSDVRRITHSRDVDPVLQSLASPDHGLIGGKREKAEEPLLMTQSIDLTASGTITRSNFYHLKFPDTRHITTPPSNSTFFSNPDSWVRKSDPTFSFYQREDANKRGSHLQQCKDRFSWARSRESEIERAVNEELEKKKLAIGFKQMAKQRYAERAFLTEKAAKREGMDNRSSSLFSP